MILPMKTLEELKIGYQQSPYYKTRGGTTKYLQSIGIDQAEYARKNGMSIRDLLYAIEGTSREKRKTTRGQVSTGRQQTPEPLIPNVPDALQGLRYFADAGQAQHDWLQEQYSNYATLQHNKAVQQSAQDIEEINNKTVSDTGLEILGWLTSLYGVGYPFGQYSRYTRLFNAPAYYTTQGLGTAIDGVQLLTDDGAYNTTKNAIGFTGGLMNILGESNALQLIPGWGRTADKIVDITGTTSDWYNTVEQPVQWIKSVED